MKIKLSIILGAALMLFGCGSVDPKVYEGTKPEISFKEFYSGPVEGYGFFQSRGGEVQKRYHAILTPVWNGNNGEIDDRQWDETGKLFMHLKWKIKIVDDKNFIATADKIENEIDGKSRGFAMHMEYSLKVPRENGSEISVNCDDWTYLQPDGTAINQVSMSKFGFHVGDVVYKFRKAGKGEQLHEGYFPPAK